MWRPVKRVDSSAIQPILSTCYLIWSQFWFFTAMLLSYAIIRYLLLSYLDPLSATVSIPGSIQLFFVCKKGWRDTADFRLPGSRCYIVPCFTWASYLIHSFYSFFPVSYTDKGSPGLLHGRGTKSNTGRAVYLVVPLGQLEYFYA